MEMYKSGWKWVEMGEMDKNRWKDEEEDEEYEDDEDDENSIYFW